MKENILTKPIPNKRWRHLGDTTSFGGEIADVGGVFYPRIGVPDLPSMFLADGDHVIDYGQEVDLFRHKVLPAWFHLLLGYNH